MSKNPNVKPKYEVIVQEDDNGDLLLPIPPEVLAELGWKEGDDIKVDLDDSGRIIVRKV